MSTADTVVNRVRTLAAPIVADLGLEIYDLEMVSGVLRLSIDTPTGGPAGVTLDNIALVSRLVSRELDHNDPMPGRYTLEVTSPGLERPLRTADHFRREVNKVVSVRLREAVDGNQDDMREAVRMIAADRGLSVDALLQVLVEALATAYKKRPNAADEVIVGLNPETMDITFTAYDVDYDGNWINERDDTPSRAELGRIAASTFRAVLSQRIREVEYAGKYEQFRNKEGEIVAGRIRLMPSGPSERKYLIIDMSGGEGIMPLAEQVPNELRTSSDATFKVFIVEVRETERGPQVVVSRTHPGLVFKLFQMEVPEIVSGQVSIMAIAREPGQRCKIAVASNDERVDPIGACVGQRGSRVQRVVTELRNEKIDIVQFSDDKRTMIINAMSPAKVSDVIISEDGTQADVIVPDFQLSLAIGRAGINAKLAAQLCGLRLDVKSESEAAGLTVENTAAPTTDAGSPTA
ncbi:MAG: transcription termination factor NusA [Acidimicrobiia bacterium]|nr:transcription termination factor NusA [Acidimicrobiia bacterium]